MYAWQFSKALHLSRQNGWTRFVSMQNYYNLLYREEEREMMGLCADEVIGIIPWSPMARGRLARPWSETTHRTETDEFGKYLYSIMAEADAKVVHAVQQLAIERGVSMAQIALAWVLHKQPVTSPIIGASKPNHLSDAVSALNLKLSDSEIGQLESAYMPHPVIGHS